MNVLKRITNWPDRAREAQFQRQKLALACGVSCRYLNKFFVEEFHRPPQEWLDELRMWDAWRMLAEGKAVKEVAYMLGFKQVSHFSRVFKGYHGVCPSLCEEAQRSILRKRIDHLQRVFPGEVPSCAQPRPHWLQAQEALSLQVRKNEGMPVFPGSDRR